MCKTINRFIVTIFALLILPANALGWSSKTHIFIAQEAGVKNPEAACFPDLSRKDNGALLGPFHWHDASPNAVVTPDYIDQYQISEGNYIKADAPKSKPLKIKVPDPCGVLYWKIMELYQAMKGATGWEYEYYLTNIAHYVGDLSQPLHNFPYGSEPASDGKSYPEVGTWAKEHHREFDDILESSFPLDKKKEEKFLFMVSPPEIKSIDDLKREISKIANNSIALANKCYSEKRIINQDEALKQVAMSVSLLKAIIVSTKK
ncbi:MAG: hypothetical protein ACLQUS_14860 [Desulfobaccales bacterium]